MADFQIGQNLYANDKGQYWNVNSGVRKYVDSPYDTMQSKINGIYDTQRQSQLNQLKAQRDKAISGFNQQKQDLAPQYAAQRNQADVTNAQNVSRLRELMAANGINMSGENVTAQANMNSARQNAFNDINNNQQQAYSAIDRQIANANDPSQEQSINDSIATERSKALLDAFNQAQQTIQQQAQVWLQQQAEIAKQQLAARSSSGSHGSSGSSTSASAVPKVVQEQAKAYNQWFAPKTSTTPSQNLTYSTNGIKRLGY